MSKVKLNIWNRLLILPIYYECDSDEKVLDVQKEAVNSFVNNSRQLLKSDEEVVKYCLSDKKNTETQSIQNVFKYVMPVSLLAKRSKKDHIVVLLCNYKFDIEHGLAVVFKNEKFLKITSQDNL